MAFDTIRGLPIAGLVEYESWFFDDGSGVPCCFHPWAEDAIRECDGLSYFGLFQFQFPIRDRSGWIFSWHTETSPGPFYPVNVPENMVI